MLAFDRIRQASVQDEPFPYMLIEDVLHEEQLDKLLEDFPDIRHPGSIPLSAVRSGPAFDRLIEQLNSPEFRALVQDKFALDLQDKPIMTTVRGMMRAQRDGRVHTDSRDKLITILLYFNRDWQHSGGHLRLLRSRDLEDYALEIPPKLGTMLIFKVTEDGWHGHKPVEGPRLSIQMNYLTGSARSSKHQFLHRLSARLKKLRGQI